MKDKPIQEQRKLNMFENGDKMSQMVAKQRKEELKLVPLRIDSRTVILVPISKATKEYAEKKYLKMREEVSLSRLKR